MKMSRMIAVGAVALTLSALAMPAAAQHRYDRHRGDDDGDAVAGLVIGAVVGGIAGAVIGDGDDRYVAGGALAGAALGAAAASDDDYRGYRSYGSYGYSYAPSYSYSGYGGGYRSDCDYWRDGRCWRNRGHWEREHGINSRDPRWEQRRDYRDYRRDERRDRRDDRRDRRDDDRHWRNY
ncbi:hypothetical protein [Brevundimonas sp. NIBR11]|uniref:hypothetical protein n=1 Tax=Brevundimonas sp. NIBR11 TaxID=3015999 RepID=UPI0022F13D5C|nr:hypothetical protein [Brevundimonas sp. NIBR11]WGM32712.1 hypothetical protein KKHFBJBL_02966 [Brevundimonas sp. NIBR11]